MKLRTRGRASGGYCELSSDSEEEGNTVEEYSPDEAGPSSAKPKKVKTRPSKSTQASSPKCPELLPLVVNTARQGTFDTSSLRALCSTNKTLKEAIGRLFPLNHIKLRGADLSSVLTCTNLIERMQQLTINGEFDLTTCTQLVQHTFPALKQLTVASLGRAAPILICGKFSNLTSLTLNKVAAHGNSFGNFCTVPTWALRQLTLDGSFSAVSAAHLHGIIARFSELTELSINRMKISHSYIDHSKRPPNVLEKLEKLDLGHNIDFLRLQFHRLFRSPKEGLPTVRSLVISTEEKSILQHLTTASEWVKNLDSLSLLPDSRSVYRASHAESADYERLFASLQGGSLKRLELSWAVYKTSECFNSLNLPHLTELKLEYDYNNDITSGFLTELSGATLPALTSLSVSVKYPRHDLARFLAGDFEVDHVDGMMAAFPNLSSVSLKQFPRMRPNTLNDIGRHVLPFVQELYLDGEMFGNEDVKHLMKHLVDAHPGSPAMCPSLRVLDIPQTSRDSGMIGLEILAPIARHMPNLKRLMVSKENFPYKTTWKHAEVYRLRSALTGAWPELQELHCALSQAAAIIRTLWPKAKIS